MTYLELSPAARHGLRFFRWSLDPDDESSYGDDIFEDASLTAEAQHVADEVASTTNSDADWGIVPNGGAGDGTIIELAAKTLGILYMLVKLPGAAAQTWKEIEPLFAKMKQSATHDWNASSEVAILRCLAIIHHRDPLAFTDPDAVRVIQDGTNVGVNADMPVGLHIVVIPEMRRKQTHVFVIDGKLEIRAHNTIDALTTDATMLPDGR